MVFFFIFFLMNVNFGLITVGLFRIAEKWKPWKIHRGIYDLYGKAWLNMGMPLQPEVKKAVYGVETLRLSGREIIQVQQSEKKIM